MDTGARLAYAAVLIIICWGISVTLALLLNVIGVYYCFGSDFICACWFKIHGDFQS